MTTDLEIINAFAQSLSAKAPKTIKAYVVGVQGFSTWLATMPGGKPFTPEIITEIAIKNYLAYLKEKGLSPRTRSLTLTALRRFCRWAVYEGYINRNPANQVPRPTVINTAPRELTPEQRYILRSRVEMEKSSRLSAIFALGYWVGLRISEIAQLELAHCQINKRVGQISIMDSKGSKTRILDLHREARRALYEYLYYKEGGMYQDTRDPESKHLFTSQRATWLRQQGKPDHLTTRGLEFVWTNIKERASFAEYELIKEVTFHDLRHDFAHRARAGGWELEEIAVYLGHQTRDGAPAIATTARYTMPSRQQLKKKLKQLSG